MTALLRACGRAWNWKSALVSTLSRAAIFFVVNLPAGLAAATAAGQTEFVYRAIASGFYGALTEWFAGLGNTRATTLAALVVVPGVAHTVEFVIHWWAGTPVLGPAILASVAFSVVTTRLNLFAMRRGLLVVGPGCRSLPADVRDLTRLLWLTLVRFTSPTPGTRRRAASARSIRRSSMARTGSGAT
jgi:hypothetical protein